MAQVNGGGHSITFLAEEVCQARHYSAPNGTVIIDRMKPWAAATAALHIHGLQFYVFPQLPTLACVVLLLRNNGDTFSSFCGKCTQIRSSHVSCASTRVSPHCSQPLLHKSCEFIGEKGMMRVARHDFPVLFTWEEVQVCATMAACASHPVVCGV